MLKVYYRIIVIPVYTSCVPFITGHDLRPQIGKKVVPGIKDFHSSFPFSINSSTSLRH